MRTSASLLGRAAMLLAFTALSACSGSIEGNVGKASDSNSAQSRLVGTWTFSGAVPNLVNITLTFKPDQTLSFAEQVAPATEPAGPMPDRCIVTLSFSATYIDSYSGGSGTLDWSFTSGVANVVSSCNDPSHDSPGTPLTAEALTGVIAEGDVPPMAMNYSVTSTTLFLSSPNDDSPGVGRSGTAFTKAD